jgi:mono/diheme cytochrome c family protein
VKAAAGTAIALAGAAGALYAWAGSAAQAKFDRAWPDVAGKDLPIPFPLTEAEIGALRLERLAAMPPPDPSAPPLEAADAVPVDPLAGLDLDAIALERAVARGARLATTRLGCVECHRADGGGGLVADAMPVWRFTAPNITVSGRTKDFTAADFNRILRHGVGKDGTTSAMPAVDTARLSDREVSDLAAWVRSLPPSDRESEEIEIGPLGRFLFALDQIPLSAERIDHAAARPVEPPPEAVEVAFGAHVAQTCVGCHRDNFEGGPILGGDPAWPPAANLTPHESGLKGWTAEQFRTLLREGKRPDGSVVSDVMPYKMLKAMSDTEIDAMFLYLQSLAPLPKGT